MAKIEPIDNKIHWSPAACLGNLLENADELESVMVIHKYKNDGKQYCSCGNLTIEQSLLMVKLEEDRLIGMVRHMTESIDPS